MPRAPLHALIWSREQSCYDLYIRGRLERRFRPADETPWLAWLGAATSFAFHGASGSLNVYREARPRGGCYWYAYHTINRRTRKRYLGPATQVTFARLEETARALASAPTPAAPAASDTQPAAEQPLLPLSPRLAPPRLPHALVDRERLLEMLDGALSTPLTLLSAAAGWGKTTLLSAWVRRRQVHVAWLSLCELDTSPTRFWVSLIAALRRCGGYAPGLGDTTVALLQSPQPPPVSACITALLHELDSQEAHPASTVLIVDDYQLVDDPTIHEGMGFFLEHLPAHLHLILSSRADPPFPLARWRVRGQLTEIRTADLRFELEEARSFLGHMLTPPLPDEEVHLLVCRTEGWIAGLHLAALALRQREDRAAFLQAFTGSHRYLLEFVQEDILACLPLSVRDFLLQTAILSRLDASVCQAVTAAPSSAACQQMLAFLERANLFLVPLDEERRWYRLHDLFRDALLAALRATRPEVAPVLHRRAAGYYEAQGQWSEAIVHRLAAGDFAMAARLMESTVEQFWVRGEAATMARWVTALPRRLVREHARLVLTTALYLLNTVTLTTGEERARVQQQARQLMARVETALLPHAGEAGDQRSATGADGPSAFPADAPDCRAVEDALLHRRLRLLHMFLAGSEATARGDLMYLRGMEQEIEEELDRDDEPLWQMVPLAHSFILHYTVRGEGARLLPRLLDAREQVRRSGSCYVTIKVMQWLVLAAAEAGQIRLAYQESLAALDLIEQVSGYTLLRGYFELVQAQVLYQWNRLEDARNLLQAMQQAATAWQQLDLLGASYAELLRVALARCEWPPAQQAQQEMERLVQRERFAHYPGWLPTMRAHWWLAQGQLKEAAAWAAGVVFPEEPWDNSAHDAFPVVIRVYFAQQRWREAVELLERWSGRLDGPVKNMYTITFLAQSLVALHHAGKSEPARETAARLFALTKPEGYLRVYLDEGEPMRQALQALLTPHAGRQGPDPATTAYVSKLLTAFAQEPAPSPAPRASAASSARGASLTRREQEVLRLLAAGASNQEIAQALVIELSTVKKHVSNVLGKLGATSRARAITRARALSLL